MLIKKFCTHSKFCVTLFFWIVFIVHSCYSQLTVNVKNKGGDVIQEVIDSNITADIVTVKFRRSDGTLMTQLIDFINVSCAFNFLNLLIKFCSYNIV